MPRRCTICHHPQNEEIAVSLFRDGTRFTARQFQLSLPALHRHKGHLPGTIVKAQQAEVVCEATSAAAAKLEKNWPAATSALREARGCLELLGKLRGELQQPGALHLHKHAHIHSAAEPRNEAEIELEIARHVAAATANFDAQEITRPMGA